MAQLPRVRDYMTRRTKVLHANTNIYEAAEILADTDLSNIPVLDTENQVIGVLTEKDCLRAIVNEAVYDEPADTVGEYLSEVTTSISPDTDLLEVALHFLHTNFKMLPVIEQGEFVGAISRKDVLRGVAETRRSLEIAQKRKRLAEIASHPVSKAQFQHLMAAQNKKELARILRERYRGRLSRR